LSKTPLKNKIATSRKKIIPEGNRRRRAADGELVNKHLDRHPLDGG
jgi:hypothetical protein